MDCSCWTGRWDGLQRWTGRWDCSSACCAGCCPALRLRGRCGLAVRVGLSALACVFPVGSNCIILAGPVRSGWACRLLCARLCLPCGVESRYACGTGAELLGLSAPLRVFVFSLPDRLVCVCEAGVEWLGTSASLRSLVSSLWGRIALCSWCRCGVAGHVGFSALACVFPVGSNCASLAEPARSGWACRPLCARLCPCCGVGLRRLFVFLCLFCVYVCCRRRCGR